MTENLVGQLVDVTLDWIQKGMPGRLLYCVFEGTYTIWDFTFVIYPVIFYEGACPSNKQDRDRFYCFLCWQHNLLPDGHARIVFSRLVFI